MSRWRNKQTQSELFDMYEFSNTRSLSNITLESCGLNKENNFLQAPICECGCGNKCDIILYDKDDVINFCEEMCYENDCKHCAVFAITNENEILMAIKCEDEVVCYGHAYEDNPEIVGSIFNELELHCFGLVIYNGNDCYRVVEE